VNFARKVSQAFHIIVICRESHRDSPWIPSWFAVNLSWFAVNLSWFAVNLSWNHRDSPWILHEYFSFHRSFCRENVITLTLFWLIPYVWVLPVYQWWLSVDAGYLSVMAIY
jgi:hypothetical protein